MTVMGQGDRQGWLGTHRLALIALLAGGLYVPWCIGWAPLDPTDLSWLANDPATAFLGWAFLRDEPAWLFPPTWSTRFGWPAGASTAHSDLVPLVALPLRLVEGLLPRDFQYFGLVALANGVLQAFFGLLLARRLSGGRLLPTLVGGLFFLLSGVFLNRLHGHFALQAQWLLLVSLLVYLDAARAPDARRRFAWALLLLWLAGGINPYLAAMTALLLAAALLRARLAARLGWPALVGAALAGGIVLLASLLLHGFLVPGEGAGLSAWGFGIYSTNVLSLVGPTGASWFLPDLPLTDPRQAGGSGYLGLGMILLLAAALPGLWRALRQVPARRWWPLLAAALLAFLFAVSHRVGIGGWLALEIPLPAWAERLANMLRASGRFVWIPHYLLIAAAIWVLARWRWRQGATAALLLAAAVQLVDGQTQRDYVRWANSIGYRLPPMTSPMWQGLGVEHAHLVVLPAWQCGNLQSPGGNPGFWYFGEIARRERLTINSVYLPRHSDEFRHLHCRTLPARFVAAGPDPATAYVLGDAFARLLAMTPLPGHLCGQADDFVVCRHVAGRRGLTPALRQRLFAVLPLGLTQRLDETSPYLVPGAGWDEGAAGIAFRTPATASSLRLRWTCEGLPDEPAETAEPWVDGTPQPLRLRRESGSLAVDLGRLPADSLVGVPLPGGFRGALPACDLLLEEEP